MVRRVVHKNIILLILALAQFMVVLDVSIVNVALPSIYRSLHFTSTNNLQWIITAYALTFGGFLLLGGRAADLYGRKKVFMYATAVFAVGSVICGFSQNSITIEIMRAVQGLAGAFMSPAALSLVLTTFKEGKERNMALSVWGAVAAGGAAVGVLVGGILTQYLSWRWNFFVNGPVGAGVLIATLFYVPESKADLDHRQLDLPGAVSVTGGLILLVYGLSKAPTYGWGSGKTWEFLGSSIVLLALFVFNEMRTKHPLMPLSIFRIKNVAAANLTILPTVASLYAMFFFITLYIQNILHYSPVRSGVSFLPIAFIIGIVSGAMSKVVTKIGFKTPMLIAPFFVGGGLFYLAHIRLHGTYFLDVLPGLAMVAIGMGMNFVAITIAATNGVPHKESGLASGIFNTSQQVGGALGLAVLSGVSASATTSYLASHHYIASAVNDAQIHGFKISFYTGVVFAALAFIAAVTLVKYKHGEKIEVDPTAGIA